jgi:hypothetical protein
MIPLLVHLDPLDAGKEIRTRNTAAAFHTIAIFSGEVGFYMTH